MGLSSPGSDYGKDTYTSGTPSTASRSASHAHAAHHQPKKTITTRPHPHVGHTKRRITK